MSKIKLLILIVFTLTAVNSFSQCVFGSQYESEEVNKSVPIASDDLDDLPDNFLDQVNLIEQFFQIKSQYRYYNDEESSAAKILCSCSSKSPCEYTVFVGRKLIDFYQDKPQKDGLWGLVAHELAHALQCKWGTHKNLNGIQRELHADFVAGYFLGYKSKFTLTDIRQFSEELFKRGDFEFNSKDHHGTPLQRVQAMIMGASLSMLTLSDAYNYGLRYFSGNAGFYNVNGIWFSNYFVSNNMSVGFQVFHSPGIFGFFPVNTISGQPLAGITNCSQIDINQFRITWPSFSPYFAGITQDFLVINSNVIVVMWSNGYVDLLYR